MAVLTIAAAGCAYQKRAKPQPVAQPSYPIPVKVVGEMPKVPVEITVSHQPAPAPQAQVQPKPTSPEDFSEVVKKKYEGIPYISPEEEETFSRGEVYLSGGLRDEVEELVIRELRNFGYKVTEKKSKSSLVLRIRIARRGRRIICTAFMSDPNREIVAQGRGESFYFRASGWFREELKYRAEIKAALSAIEEMAADHQ